MRRRPPRSTRTDTLFPYTTLFRSARVGCDCRNGRFRWPDAAIPYRRIPYASRIDAPCRKCAEAGRTHRGGDAAPRSEEHTSELQSLMRISYAVFCLINQKKNDTLINLYQS